jgi:biotin transport system substrate-specific component
MESTSVIARPRPHVLADLIPGERVRDVALVLGGAAFVGALAQLSIRLPFTPVPITGQTLGVLVVGCALGFHRALAATVLYAGLGIAGLPWFVDHTAGWQGASSGYVAGFILAAAVCGSLAERGADRNVLRSLPAMLAGELCIYVPGVLWLAIDLHVGLITALSLGLVPFLAGDAVKIGIAAGLLPAAWWVTGTQRRDG